MTGCAARLSRPSVGSVAGRSTALVLGAVGVVHVVWATGSTFPFTSRAALNDTVVGRHATPGPAECLAVAALLATAAGAVTSADRRHGPVSRLVTCGVALVLATRAAFGLAGRTAILVPGSESERFKRMDRTVYAPLCAALAVGALTTAR